MGGYGGYGDTNWWSGGEYDATADWLRGFNGANGFGGTNRDLNAGRSNAFYDMLTSGGSFDPRSWYGGAQGTQSKASGLLESLANASKASTKDQTTAFLQSLPGLERYASRTADKAYSLGGLGLEGLLKSRSLDSRRAAESRLTSGGMLGASSGAAVGALESAAQSPLMETLARIGELRANAYQGALNPLAQMGYGRELGRTNEFAQALQGASGLMGQQASIGSGLAGLLGQQSEQMMLAPDIRQRQGMGDQLLLTALATGGNALLGGGGSGLLEGFLNFLNKRGTQNPASSSSNVLGTLGTPSMYNNGLTVGPAPTFGLPSYFESFLQRGS